jgi:ABC-type lipoprotein release transport system permease subunit
VTRWLGAVGIGRRECGPSRTRNAFQPELAALLFAVQPLDAVSLGIGMLLSVIVTIGASLVPAIAAASVNPAEALRQD